MFPFPPVLYEAWQLDDYLICKSPTRKLFPKMKVWKPLALFCIFTESLLHMFSMCSHVSFNIYDQEVELECFWASDLKLSNIKKISTIFRYTQKEKCSKFRHSPCDSKAICFSVLSLNTMLLGDVRVTVKSEKHDTCQRSGERVLYSKLARPFQKSSQNSQAQKDNCDFIKFKTVLSLLWLEKKNRNSWYRTQSVNLLHQS